MGGEREIQRVGVREGGFTDEREAHFDDQLELRITDVERTKGNSHGYN